MKISLAGAAPLLMAAFVFSPAAQAQKLVGAQLDKPQIQTGQSVQLSVDFEMNDNPFCGMRIDWGDGSDTEVKVEGAGFKTPHKASHTDSKAGEFAVKAEPRRVTSHLPCLGKAQSAMVKVVAPPPPPAAPAPAPVAPPAAPPASAPMAAASAPSAGPQCPTGWKLDAKSVNKKSGAYSCSAKPGTTLPEKKLACPGDTGYFENAKKGVLGCRV